MGQPFPSLDAVGATDGSATSVTVDLGTQGTLVTFLEVVTSKDIGS